MLFARVLRRVPGERTADVMRDDPINLGWYNGLLGRGGEGRAQMFSMSPFLSLVMYGKSCGALFGGGGGVEIQFNISNGIFGGPRHCPE